MQDPEARKPDDWDEREEIDDPADTRPADWEKPQYMPDPNAKKPEDWDDEMDGSWEAPQIDNPEYKVLAHTLHSSGAVLAHIHSLQLALVLPPPSSFCSTAYHY